MQVRVERRQLDSQRRNAEYGDREEFQGLSVLFYWVIRTGKRVSARLVAKYMGRTS